MARELERVWNDYTKREERTEYEYSGKRFEMREALEVQLIGVTNDDRKKYDLLLEGLLEYGGQREHDGFVQGYMAAVRLMAECLAQ